MDRNGLEGYGTMGLAQYANLVGMDKVGRRACFCPYDSTIVGGQIN